MLQTVRAGSHHVRFRTVRNRGAGKIRPGIMPPANIVVGNRRSRAAHPPLTMAAEARSFRQQADDVQSVGAGGLFASPTGPRITPLRELQLLETFRAGGTEAHKAVTELLQAYQRRIYSVCYRMVRKPEDAADLTQDVLLKLVENLSSYDGRSKLSTWIIRVAMNASLSHLRRQKTRDVRSLDAGAGRLEIEGSPTETQTPTPPAREPSPLQGVQQQQQRTLVLRALDALDVDTRAILVLRDMHDMDYQQLAEALDVPIGTVKSRLFRARAAFREVFESLGG
jgi:RNA polymerase sigma-70 factor (ECF subfamily)